MKCYKCGTENPDGAKFCLECGNKLQALEPTVEERKFATILYSDLKGYSTLSEQRDPEQIREIIKNLFSQFETILNEFQVGHREYIGDATLALFGVPTSYPDDAERAINAGLAMQEAIKSFSNTIGVQLSMRIGINSGEVVYGEIPGKITVTGDAVNTAQRLESVATPGRVLISSTTAKLVAGKFSIIPLPKLTLKGKKEKVIAFEVISPKRTYPTFTSPMIGRDKEFETLKEIFKTNQTPSFTVIKGDAGVGKSRLIFEFQRYLDETIPESPIPIKVVGLRCWPRATSAYQPLADLIRVIVDIREPEETKNIMSKIEKSALSHDPLSKHFLGFFLGIKWEPSPLDHLQPDSARLSAFVTLKNFIEHISNDQQIVIIFEDFHYADSGTVDFLKYLTQTELKGKIMLLIVGRNESSTEEIRREDKWNFIELSPLKAEESKTLVQNYFQEISEEMFDQLLKKTGGNPLFLEEFARDLRERGPVLKETEVFLPDSLWALLESRIDRLPAMERYVLRAASVIGRVFWVRTLSILVKGIMQHELNSCLQQLERKGYIYEQRPSQMLKDREYIFKHDLLREASYKTILKKQRKEFHREILSYLEDSFRKGEMRTNLYFQLAAYHSELGEEYEKAVELYEKAGDNARERYAVKEAIVSYSSAIGILTETLGIKENKKIGELLRKRGDLLSNILSMYEEAVKDFEKLIRFKDKEMKIWGLLGVASVYRRKGNFDKTIEYGLKAKDISEKSELNELRADALLSMAQAYWKKGVFDKGLEFSEYSYNIYKKIEKEDTKSIKKKIASSIGVIGTIHLQLGNYEDGLNFLKESLKLCREVDDKVGSAAWLNNIGVVYQNIGDYDKAMEFHKQSLKIKNEIGDKYTIAGSLNNIGDIYRCKGNYKKALEFLTQSLETAKQIAHKLGVTNSLINIGHIYGKFGEYEKGLTYIEEAQKLSTEMGAKQYLVQCLYEKSEIYNEMGRFLKSIEFLKQALEICESLKLKLEMCDTLYLLSQASIGQSNIKEAENYLTKGEKIAKECKSKEAEESILLGYVKLYLYKQNYKEAKEFSKKLLTLLDETKRRDALFVEALWLMGKSLHGLGDKDNANEYFSKSLSLARKMRLKPIVKKIQPPNI